MPVPTRGQIVADVTLPTFAVEVFNAGVWVNISAHVVRASADLEATGGEPTGVAMGPAVSPSADVELFAGDAATAATLRGYEADRKPVRISFGFDTSDKLVRFGGVLMEWGGQGLKRTWRLRGWDALIEATEVRSLAYRRRATATKTTATSVENPTLSTYQGGLINYILWQCGGRPLEQLNSYPAATFYYSSTQALISPEFTWCPGGNPWELIRKLCRSSGGQVYQDTDGTIKYLDPITLATGTPIFTFSDEVLTQAQRTSQGKAGYQTIGDRHDSSIATTGVTCNYVSRIVLGSQKVYEDSTPREIKAGAALTVTCDTQLPLYSMQSAEIDVAIIRSAAKANGAQVTVTPTLTAAQRVTLVITNTLTESVMVDAIRVFGRPISAGEEGSASYIVSPGRIVTVEDSPFIQSARHAQMICRMVYDGTNNSGTVYSLGKCGYDPDRYVGEVVGLTSSDYGLSNLRCRIVSITKVDGAWMDVELAPLGSLPTTSSVHIIGAVSGTKDMAY